MLQRRQVGCWKGGRRWDECALSLISSPGLTSLTTRHKKCVPLPLSSARYLQVFPGNERAAKIQKACFLIAGVQQLPVSLGMLLWALFSFSVKMSVSDRRALMFLTL